MQEFNKYEVYTATGSIYCYRDSNVLVNRFSIKDGVQLKKLETDISLIRQQSMLLEPISGRFTPNHLCRIHRYLFSDIYRFAGRYRHEDIMKGSTRFLAHAEIPQKLKTLLLQLQAENYLKGLSYESFIERGAYYLAELNYIHPFREGNGRSIREFMRLLFAENGYGVEWTAVSTETLLAAMESSIYDTAELKKVLKLCLANL